MASHTNSKSNRSGLGSRNQSVSNAKTSTRHAVKEMPKTKASSRKKPKAKTKKKRSFGQRLGSLTVRQACNLLGDEGAKLMQRGGREFEVDFDRDVYLGRDVFRVAINDHSQVDPIVTTTLTVNPGRRKSLLVSCDQCIRVQCWTT